MGVRYVERLCVTPMGAAPVTSITFDERTKGSHHIFTMEGIPEILNLQPKGAKAKAYQVRQVRGVILKYRLAGENDE